MYTPLRIAKAIEIPAWDASARQNAVIFWQKRGMVFTEITDISLTGHRGSWFGNLTSYDMSKLKAILTTSQIGPQEIFCSLEINTEFQMITEWNKAYWELELKTLESFLVRGDQREQEWEQFQKDSKAAAWQWSLSFTWLGRKLPKI